MSRNWWLAIQARYPSALEECLQYYQKKYPSTWREELQDPSKLQQYFLRHHIEADTTKGWKPGGHRYGCIVKNERLQFERALLFIDRERALVDAIYFAFLIHEEAIVSKRLPPAPPKKYRRGRKPLK